MKTHFKMHLERFYAALFCIFFVTQLHSMEVEPRPAGYSEDISNITLTEFTNLCFKTIPECNLQFPGGDLIPGQHDFLQHASAFSETFITALAFKNLLQKFISTFSPKNPRDFFTTEAEPLNPELIKQLPSFCQSESISDTCYIATVGDQHGSVHASIRNAWELVSDPNISLDNNFKIKNNSMIIFNGDYIDRGHHSVETLILCMLLKLANPNKVFLLRGNHEYREFYIKYGLQNELKVKFGTAVTNELLNCLDDFFNQLPSALILKYRQRDEGKPQYKILFCHGGIPSSVPTFRTVPESESIPGLNLINFISSEKKYLALNTSEMLNILCSDFYQSQRTNGDIVYNSVRGIGIMADVESALQWMDMNSINLIVRGHQHSDHAVKLLFRDQNELKRHINSNDENIDLLASMEELIKNLEKIAQSDPAIMYKSSWVAEALAKDLQSFIPIVGAGPWSQDAEEYVNKILTAPEHLNDFKQMILTMYKDKSCDESETNATYKSDAIKFLKFRHYWDIVLKDGSQIDPAHWKDAIKPGDVNAEGIIIQRIVPIITLSTATEGVGLPVNSVCVLKITPDLENWRLKIYETDLRHGMPVRKITDDPIVQKYTTISPCAPHPEIPFTSIFANWSDTPVEEPVAQPLIERAFANVEINKREDIQTAPVETQKADIEREDHE